jgi:hypothetical protein
LKVCDDEVSVMSLKSGCSRVRVTRCVLGASPFTAGISSSNSSWTWQVSFW